MTRTRRSAALLLLLLLGAGACLDASPGGGDGDGPDGGGGGSGVIELFVAAGAVDEDLEDYPLLVSLEANAELAGGARDDGSDLELRAADGTVLPHEIELWDPDAGTLVAWVRVPRLLADADTDLALHHGGMPETAGDPSSVWDGFDGVWHMNDLSDSRGGAEGAATEGVTKVPGRIAGGQRFDGGQVVMGDPEGGALDYAEDESFTFSMWLQVRADTGTYQTFLSKGGTMMGEVGYSLETTPDGASIYGCLADGDAYECTPEDAVLPGDEWALVTVVVDRGDGLMGLYLNGARIRTNEGIAAVDPDEGSNASPLVLGATAGGGYTVDGRIDEVRVTGGVLSDAWIAADAVSQAIPAAFVQLR